MSKKISNPQKVFVGLSGGVDSAVSAALLLRDGYDVTGVYIKVWQPDWIECNWKEERRDAMRVAAHLGIPFVTLDLVKEYKQGVINYMIAEYSSGRTPNPDVMCNREVKFGGFWKWAKAQGADFIATGHYSRVEKVKSAKVKAEKGVEFSLLAGVDKNKDQSYFLWTLNQKDLKHVLFPVGHLTKPEVRKLAEKFDLPNAEKKDSQGLCFIGKVDVKEFLKHYVKTEKGNVLNEKGEIIGTHPGALLFTIGERHGFTLTVKTPNDQPFYVVGKNMATNTITVSQKCRKNGHILESASKTLDTSKSFSIPIGRVNWVKNTPKIGEEVLIRVRYRQPLVKATIKDSTTLIPSEKIDAITPGQSLVIYKGEECLGGGIIL